MQKLKINNCTTKGLNQAFKEFYKQKEYEGLSPKTLEKYEFCWREFEAAITAANTALIGRDSINEYLYYLRNNTGTSDITQRIRVQQIRVAI